MMALFVQNSLCFVQWANYGQVCTEYVRHKCRSWPRRRFKSQIRSVFFRFKLSLFTWLREILFNKAARREAKMYFTIINFKLSLFHFPTNTEYRTQLCIGRPFNTKKDKIVKYWKTTPDTHTHTQNSSKILNCKIKYRKFPCIIFVVQSRWFCCCRTK